MQQCASIALFCSEVLVFEPPVLNWSSQATCGSKSQAPPWCVQCDRALLYCRRREAWCQVFCWMSFHRFLMIVSSDMILIWYVCVVSYHFLPVDVRFGSLAYMPKFSAPKMSFAMCQNRRPPSLWSWLAWVLAWLHGEQWRRRLAGAWLDDVFMWN